MKTYAETVNLAREMAHINNRNCYVYHNVGWQTTMVEDFAKEYGSYCKCFPNGLTEKVVARNDES